MSQKHTVTINGTVYDSRTGMPLRTERDQTTPRRHAGNVHTPLQKSKTLNRKYIAREPKPVEQVETPAITHTPERKAVHAISKHRAPAPAAPRPRHEAVSRFHKPAQPASAHHKVINDMGPVKHPLQAKVEAKQQPVAQRVVKPSDVLKKEAIATAIAATPAKHTKKSVKPERKTAKVQRFAGLASASLAVLILGAYLTYLNMPAISTRVAAAQAGINATYPGYQPSGYSLSGPVAYELGDVTMKFAANGSSQSYTLSQSRSEWDSSAVLSNYITPQAGDNYSETTTSGLTIYRYGTSAAWVNGGILYTISGNAPLSNDQIQRIATSL